MSTDNFRDNFIPKLNQVVGKEISAIQTVLDGFIWGDSLLSRNEYESEVGYWSIENWQNAEIIS